MASDTTVTNLWRMLDVITPMALRVAATLRLSDLIQAGHGDIADLAARAGADRDALARLLRHLAARGVYVEAAPGRFELTELAACLLDDHPSGSREWLDLEGFGGRMDLAFFDLLATVRAGRPPEDGHKAKFSAAITASYDTVMEAQSRLQAPAIAAAIDLAGVGHVVDVGGGTGTLLAEVLRAHPKVRGTLLELPATAETARRVLGEAGLADRCQVVAGDLFEVMPAAGDVHLWKFVIHALNDEEAARGLRRCRDAGRADSRIVVIEGTVGPGDDRSMFTEMDLRMLILGHGRERTLEEYRALAERAGLAVGTVTPTPVGPHLIEMRRR